MKMKNKTEVVQKTIVAELWSKIIQEDGLSHVCSFDNDLSIISR